MDAAIIAARSRPEIAAGKYFRAITMNTVFCAPIGSSSSAISILPKYAISTADPREIRTQIIATMDDFLIIEGFSMDMNRTSTCGIPKYPSPQPSPEIMSFQLASNNPVPNTQVTISPDASLYSYTLFRRLVSRFCFVATITIGTAINAAIIRSPWKKSVQHTALNPPKKV